MAYRQSLLKSVEKYGVSHANRKYNKSRSYIYFRKRRWDGSAASLACQSRRPHSHSNQHTEAELKLKKDMRRRNPLTLAWWNSGTDCAKEGTPVVLKAFSGLCANSVYFHTLSQHQAIGPIHWLSPLAFSVQYV